MPDSWRCALPELCTFQCNGTRAAALYVAWHYSDRTLRELGELAGGTEYPAVTMGYLAVFGEMVVEG
jgi:hypothetical protein